MSVTFYGGYSDRFVSLSVYLLWTRVEYGNTKYGASEVTLV